MAEPEQDIKVSWQGEAHLPEMSSYVALVKEAQAGDRPDMPDIAPDVESSALVARPAPNVSMARTFYGRCPECRGFVTAGVDGHPLCVNCGWDGQKIHGAMVRVLPNGTPLSYNQSIEVFAGNDRRMKTYRERKKAQG